jgi:hypothetical protein
VARLAKVSGIGIVEEVEVIPLLSMIVQLKTYVKRTTSDSQFVLPSMTERGVS